MVITENDRGYGKIEKVIYVSENDIPKYAEVIFTNSHSEETGRIKQIDYVDSNKNPIGYKMFFNDKYRDYWGIVSAEEVFKNNQLTEIKYTFYDGTVVSFTGNYLYTIQKFQPKLLQSFNKEIIEKLTYLNDQNKDVDKVNYQDKLGYGSTLVTIDKNTTFEKLTDEETKYIYGYFMSRGGLEQYTKVGWRKIKAMEKGKEVTFYYNEISSNHMEFLNGKGVFCYHTLGGLNDTPFNMVTASFLAK